MADIRYPFGKADFKNVTTSTSIDVNITNSGLSYVTLASNLTAATTINLIPDAEIQDGALCYVQVPNGGTDRAVTFGSTYATTLGAQTVTANQTVVFGFIFKSGKWLQISTQRVA